MKKDELDDYFLERIDNNLKKIESHLNDISLCLFIAFVIFLVKGC